MISEAIRSSNARKKLYEKVIPYKNKADLFTTDICGNDPVILHRKFQFQLSPVDGPLSQKIKSFMESAWKRSGVPDDLTGALGSFNFYAAVGSVRFSRDAVSHKTVADVTGIWVYVKDSYTFTDGEGARSQYLGHWNHKSVIVVPTNVVAATSPYAPYLQNPVNLGDPSIKGNVYYPVNNSDFRKWAIRHLRGGDFLIYTDRRFAPLNPPIRVLL